MSTKSHRHDLHLSQIRKEAQKDLNLKTAMEYTHTTAHETAQAS